MILARRILIWLNKYINRDKDRKKYGASSEYYGEKTSEKGFIGFLFNERHLRVNILDRFRLEFKWLIEKYKGKKYEISPTDKNIIRIKIWQKKIKDRLHWCEKEGYIKYAGDEIELLPEGRDFIKLGNFIIELSKKLSPLKTLLMGTGFGGTLMAIIVLIFKKIF